MSDKTPLPWSWRALLAPWAVSGSLTLSSMYLIDQTRRGLDADMNHLWATRTLLDLLIGAVQIGAIGLALTVLSFWLARLFKWKKRGFVLLTSLPVPLAIFWGQIQPSTLVAEPYAYPPTWLGPIAFGLTLAAAAASYLWVADAEKAKA